MASEQAPPRNVRVMAEVDRGAEQQAEQKEEAPGAAGRTAEERGGGENAGKTHKYTNRLEKEQSPYLLQHAHNPVDWYPWGEEAFTRAREEGKLIFLSVGYSTCHWCHVMEVESFERDDVADVMNEGFVNIKVDREERPDVDKVYMTYVQATQGGGGWPMSVFLTPSLHPVFGGTYFPPDDKYGRIGFKSLLGRVRSVWEQRRSEVQSGAEDSMAQLQEAMQGGEAGGAAGKGKGKGKAEQQQGGEEQQEEERVWKLAEKAIQLCSEQLASRYNEDLGGFGSAPKFPRPSELNLLLRAHLRGEGAKRGKGKGEGETGRRVVRGKGPGELQMVEHTLECMGRGGMHDHVGGGFHRYSVDEYWHVPHFEKMLYDQGQLANAYLDAFLVTGRPDFARMGRDILDYVRRDMTHGEGGIYSAEDADSLAAVGDERKKEGAFYVWSEKEIASILGPSSPRLRLFTTLYTVRKDGNCDLSPRSDPHNEFAGLNCLIQRCSLAEAAKKAGVPEEEAEKRCSVSDAADKAGVPRQEVEKSPKHQMLGECHKLLHEARSKRPRPHLDDKIIVAWNGLMISAFARAARILQSEPATSPHYFPDDGSPPSVYLACAARAATFVRSKLYDQESKRLRRSFRESVSEVWGFADDYAFLVASLLDLFEASGDSDWLAWAMELQETQDRLFWDEQQGAYFNTAEGDPSLLLRMKEDYDGAEPAASSAAAASLARLGAMIGGERGAEYRRKAARCVTAFEDRLSRMPLALPQMCCSLDLLAATSSPAQRQVIIAGPRDAPETEELLNGVFSVFQPNCTIIPIDPANQSDAAFWQQHNPRALAMTAKGMGDMSAATATSAAEAAVPAGAMSGATPAAYNSVAYAQKQADQLAAKATAAVAAATQTETDEATAKGDYETKLDALATAAGALPPLDYAQTKAEDWAALATKKHNAAVARLGLATKYQTSATALSALVDAATTAATTGLTAATTDLSDASTAATAAATAADANPTSALRAAAAAKYVEVAIAQSIKSAWEDHAAILTALQTSCQAVVTAADAEVTAATTDEGSTKTDKDTADSDLTAANTALATAQQAFDSAKTDYDNSKRLYETAKSYTSAARNNELDLLSKNRAAQIKLIGNSIISAKASRRLVSTITSETKNNRAPWQQKAASMAAANPDALTEMSEILASSKLPSNAL
ncbi:unnamed protein product [Closterium sp. NIES-53]